MTTLISEIRPRFTAFLDEDGDLIIVDHLHRCEIGFAFYGLADADRVARHVAEQPNGYYSCDPLGTFPISEDAQEVRVAEDITATMPARYTAVPVLVDGVAGFAFRDQRVGLEAFFRNAGLSSVAALIEYGDATINTKQAHAREQFFGRGSFLGVRIGTYEATGPEFIITPRNELES